MLKRITVVLVLTLAFVFSIAPYRQAVFSSALTEAELAVINDAAAANEDTQPKDDGGNRFVKVLAAPFKAIGRLFGHGKKDDNKLHRLSEKDVKKFESTKMTRVVDARNNVPASTPETIDTKTGKTEPPTEANSADANKKLAREHLARGRELFNQNDLNGA